MNLKLFIIGVLALLLGACSGDGGGTSTAQADGAGDTIEGTGSAATGVNSNEPGVFEIAVMGDMPYRELTGGWQRVKAEINAANVDFVVHTGDFKALNTPCSNEYYQEMLDQFNSISHPVFYTPGEKDWSICSRADNGRYYPEERLTTLRRLFTGQGNLSMGQNPLNLKRQTDVQIGYGYPENTIWQYRTVTFATVHVIGNDNGAQIPDNTDQSIETQLGGQRDREMLARTDGAVNWLNYVFTEAKAAQSSGVVVFMHASYPDWDYGNTKNTSSTPASEPMRRVIERLTGLAAGLGRPVALVHGDSHVFRVDKPLLQNSALRNAHAFTRIESFGGEDMNWVRLRIDTNPTNSAMFTAKAEMVAGNGRVIPDNAPLANCGFCTGANAFDIAVIGDTPYNEPLSSWNNLRSSINQANPAFTVHVGNFKLDNLILCNDGFFGAILGEFAQFQHPLMYTPGNSDWHDCASDTSPAGWQERLVRLREFYTTHGNITFGQPSQIFMQAQSELFSTREYSENRMWTQNNVMFATLHVVGNGNNLPANTDTSPDAQARRAEFAARQAANTDWIQIVFQEAKRQDNVGIMFFMHADPDWANDASLGIPDDTNTNEYTKIVTTLRNESILFQKPVMVAHASSASGTNLEMGEPGFAYGSPQGTDFIVDKPLEHWDESLQRKDMLENFTRVHVFGSKKVHWVKVTVDPDHPDVFLVTPQIVGSNLPAYF